LRAGTGRVTQKETDAQSKQSYAAKKTSSDPGSALDFPYRHTQHDNPHQINADVVELAGGRAKMLAGWLADRRDVKSGDDVLHS
jgi:hypothetical protein